MLVSNNMHAMPNRKTLGYECNEFGEVTVIFCKKCCEYYSTNAISSSLSTLIKSQVDKFVSGTNVVKKSNFSDHIKKSVSHFNAFKGLNQTLETPPDQTSIVTCVRGMNQKLKDQLANKANAEGVKAALENLIMKLGLNIERKERGMLYFNCTQITFFFSNSINQCKKSYS